MSFRINPLSAIPYFSSPRRTEQIAENFRRFDRDVPRSAPETPALAPLQNPSNAVLAPNAGVKNFLMRNTPKGSAPLRKSKLGAIGADDRIDSAHSNEELSFSPLLAEEGGDPLKKEKARALLIPDTEIPPADATGKSGTPGIPVTSDRAIYALPENARHGFFYVQRALYGNLNTSPRNITSLMR